ncbi:unnamed protein product [Rotaria sordida]|uniref:Uncharacterized protein n=1 Tax=Rotaria sordida TaxID=392033 RepID=A0A815QXR2_9BILA|nr:unnamed protein product [Rotaria sordida]CAF1525233.1 unnamed protein product [Rotaria sordida]CAF4116064.1 unnamed protein product [Rotaria sordida]CAF4165944.1 unnamed protein product [Rotaria sordida]
MITQYRHHVSLHKTSLPQYSYLHMNVFPQIGSQIRSLVIDCCYSILQDELFVKHFHDKISIVFPYLEKLTLFAYQHEQLVAFLNTLHNLNYLVEIRLYSLFRIQRTNHSTLV